MWVEEGKWVVRVRKIMWKKRRRKRMRRMKGTKLTFDAPFVLLINVLMTQVDEHQKQQEEDEKVQEYREQKQEKEQDVMRVHESDKP